MPRIKPLIRPQPPAHVEGDHVADLIRRYKRGNRMTWEDLAPRLGVRPVTAKVRLCKGTDRFSLGEIRKYCEALGIPSDEMGEAIVANIKGG